MKKTKIPAYDNIDSYNRLTKNVRRFYFINLFLFNNIFSHDAERGFTYTTQGEYLADVYGWIVPFQEFVQEFRKWCNNESKEYTGKGAFASQISKLMRKGISLPKSMSFEKELIFGDTIKIDLFKQKNLLNDVTDYLKAKFGTSEKEAMAPVQDCAKRVLSGDWKFILDPTTATILSDLNHKSDYYALLSALLVFAQSGSLPKEKRSSPLPNIYMSSKGEISKLTSYVKPDVALVTNVYPMHIEFLGSLENIAHAKAEIFGGLRSGGIAIYNEDTAFAAILRQEAEKYAAKVYPFGKTHHPAAELQPADEAEHCRYNAWCVLTAVEALGLGVAPAVEAVNGFAAPEGRGSRHKLNIDGRHILLIDDSYSGQPEAMKLAIRALAKLPVKGRRIAVLGKMAELGDYSRQAHIEVGQALAAAQIDAVVGVCAETKDMLAQLSAETEQYFFPTADGVADFLCDMLKDGDAVLIKGAHYSSQVFKVAAALKEFAEK